MLCKYMVTYKEPFFNGGNDYAHTMQEAVATAQRKHNTWGLTPEAIYEYNPETDRYDRLVGTFKPKMP